MDKPPANYPLTNEMGPGVQMVQPGQNVITSQPQQTIIIQTVEVNVNRPRGIPRDWSTPLCGCFDDCSSCLLGTFFPLCHLSCVASDMGESCCTACCVGLLGIRANFRGKHNLKGSLMDDCCIAAYCAPCATCQMQRELNNMKAGRAVP